MQFVVTWNTGSEIVKHNTGSEIVKHNTCSEILLSCGTTALVWPCVASGWMHAGLEVTLSCHVLILVSRRANTSSLQLAYSAGSTATTRPFKTRSIPDGTSSTCTSPSSATNEIFVRKKLPSPSRTISVGSSMDSIGRSLYWSTSRSRTDWYGWWRWEVPTAKSVCDRPWLINVGRRSDCPVTSDARVFHPFIDEHKTVTPLRPAAPNGLGAVATLWRRTGSVWRNDVDRRSNDCCWCCLRRLVRPDSCCCSWRLLLAISERPGRY